MKRSTLILIAIIICSICAFAQPEIGSVNATLPDNQINTPTQKPETMKNKMTHFAIYIDDIERAQSFYDGVFDWGFNSYGQSDFLQIKADKTEEGELIGALQSRQYSPVPEKIIGLECTIGVENVDDIIDRVKNNGGQILVPKTAIPYIGWITKFQDTEGNLICAMQYDNSAR